MTNVNDRISTRPPVRHKRRPGTGPEIAAEDGTLLRAIGTTFGDSAIFDGVSVILKAPRHPTLAAALRPVLPRLKPDWAERVTDRGLDRWADSLVGKVVDGVRIERDDGWFRLKLADKAAAVVH